MTTQPPYHLRLNALERTAEQHGVTLEAHQRLIGALEFELEGSRDWRRKVDTQLQALAVAVEKTTAQSISTHQVASDGLHVVRQLEKRLTEAEKTAKGAADASGEHKVALVEHTAKERERELERQAREFEQKLRDRDSLHEKQVAEWQRQISEAKDKAKGETERTQWWGRNTFLLLAGVVIAIGSAVLGRIVDRVWPATAPPQLPPAATAQPSR